MTSSWTATPNKLPIGDILDSGWPCQQAEGKDQNEIYESILDDSNGNIYVAGTVICEKYFKDKSWSSDIENAAQTASPKIVNRGQTDVSKDASRNSRSLHRTHRWLHNDEEAGMNTLSKEDGLGKFMLFNVAEEAEPEELYLEGQPIVYP